MRSRCLSLPLLHLPAVARQACHTILLLGILILAVQLCGQIFHDLAPAEKVEDGSYCQPGDTDFPVLTSLPQLRDWGTTDVLLYVLADICISPALVLASPYLAPYQQAPPAR